jgi:hypothetical protein
MKHHILAIAILFCTACSATKTTKFIEHKDRLVIVNEAGQTMYDGPFQKVRLKKGKYRVESLASEHRVRQIVVK